MPFGLVIIAAALRIMPAVPRRAGARLDISGAVVLFTGLLCLIGPLWFGQDVHWAPWVWLVMAAGIGIVAAFLRLERAVASRGGMPLIDLALLSDAAFMRGLCAVVMTMFMQGGLHIPPLRAGMVFVPLALAFVIASRHSAVRARHRGTLVLIEGCAIQIAGLAVLVLTVASVEAPSAPLLALVLAIFGYGQGLVMAPLSSAVLSTVQPASTGSGAGMYGTTAQIANAAGVAAIGATFFLRLKLLTRRSWRFLCRQPCLHCRSAPAPHFCHGCDSRRCEVIILGTGSTRSFYFAVQQLSVLGGIIRVSPRSCRCPSLTMSNSCDV